MNVCLNRRVGTIFGVGGGGGTGGLLKTIQWGKDHKWGMCPLRSYGYDDCTNQVLLRNELQPLLLCWTINKCGVRPDVSTWLLWPAEPAVLATVVFRPRLVVANTAVVAVLGAVRQPVATVNVHSTTSCKRII